ncbi:hypothetical protein ACHAPT_010750 [Fusarium lateritium]
MPLALARAKNAATLKPGPVVIETETAPQVFATKLPVNAISASSCRLMEYAA